VATVEHIHVTDAPGRPMLPVQSVRALAGRGLDGDRYAARSGRWSETPGTGRDLTLIEAEVIEELARVHGISLAPGESRRNVTTRGVRLNDLVGMRFQVGAVLCQGERLAEPCEYLQGLVGKPVLRPLAHRGGLRATILRDGVISVGDEIRVEAPVEAWRS
jgi:MOSC domain-containing protein YiiM